MSGIYSTKKFKNVSQDAKFSNYLSGTIPETDAKGTYIRADGDMTLPRAISGRHLNIFSGSSVSNTFEEIQTIVGGYSNEWVGFSSVLSADGSVFAYGAYRAKPNNIASSGYTRIYRKDSNGVYQEEQTIEGIYQSQQAGSRIDINGVGTRIAINSRSSTSLPVEDLKRGFTDIYDYSNGTWTKTFTAKGATFSTSGNSSYGYSTSLSKDGNTLIVGSPYNNSNRGYVEVFYYDGTSWSQKGTTMVGSASNDLFGFDVDVSENGSRIAIGQSRYTSDNTGRVQVFTFNGTNWIQYGNDMAQDVGEPSEEFGRVIKFNENGTRIVVGNPNRDTTITDAGVAVIYEDQNGTWTQIGSSLSGKDSISDLFGWVVDITDDGNTIIVGSRYNYEGDTANRKPGYANFYNWNGTDWTLTQTINPPTGEPHSALIHSLSRDGAYFAYCLPYHNTQAGKVILYNKENLNVGEKTITAKSGDSINNGTTSIVSTVKQFVCSQDGIWISN